MLKRNISIFILLITLLIGLSFSTAFARISQEKEITLKGNVLITLTNNFQNSQNTKNYSLIMPKNENIALSADSSILEKLQSGDTVQIKGIKKNKTFFINKKTDIKTISSHERTAPIGGQGTAVLLVNFSDTVAPTNIDDSFMLTTMDTVNSYYKSNSYFATWLYSVNDIFGTSSADVYPWITLDEESMCLESDSSALTSLVLDAMIKHNIGLNKYSRIVFIAPFSQNKTCGDTVSASTLDKYWAYPSALPDNGMSFIWVDTEGVDKLVTAGTENFTSSFEAYNQIISHEFGHNFGLDNANLYSCSNLAIFPNPYGSCESKDNLDLYSVMGSKNFWHYNIAEKVALGWLTESTGTDASVHIVNENDKSFEYILNPISTDLDFDTGFKGLKIPRKDGYIYLEKRAPIGFDSDDRDYSDSVYYGVLLHYVDYKPRTLTTEILNVNNDGINESSYMQPALYIGDSITDPQTGTIISVLSSNDNETVVKVTLGQ